MPLFNHTGPGVDMADELPVNFTNDPITVHYLKLARAGDGVLRSHCPFCADGVLLMVRHKEMSQLIDQDRCVSCGQAVVYADLKEAFPPDNNNEKRETRYDRDAGFPCRKCGYTTVPIYQGNALIGFYCDNCKEDFAT